LQRRGAENDEFQFAARIGLQRMGLAGRDDGHRTGAQGVCLLVERDRASPAQHIVGLGAALVSVRRLATSLRPSQRANPLGAHRQFIDPQLLDMRQESRAEVGSHQELVELHLGEIGRSQHHVGVLDIHGAADSNHRSFSVNLQKQAFQCFHPPCRAHGDVLDFWAAYHGLTLRDAGLHLADTFGISPGTPSKTKRRPADSLHKKR
jgi:hypothetical protein